MSNKTGTAVLQDFRAVGPPHTELHIQTLDTCIRPLLQM